MSTVGSSPENPVNGENLGQQGSLDNESYEEEKEEQNHTSNASDIAKENLEGQDKQIEPTNDQNPEDRIFDETKEIAESENESNDSTSSDSDSNSDSYSESDSKSTSDSSSDSSSDSESEEEGEVEVSDNESDISAEPIKSKNEQEEEGLELPEDFSIPPDAPIEYIGTITALVERSIVIKAGVSGEIRVLKDGSIICLEDRTLVGPLFETFGRIQSPSYRVKFKTEDKLEAFRDKKGAKVFYVVPESEFVLTSEIKATKGSDASNWHDEEIPEEEQEFSDDEKEAAMKALKKRKKNQKKDEPTKRPLPNHMKSQLTSLPKKGAPQAGTPFQATQSPKQENSAQSSAAPKPVPISQPVQMSQPFQSVRPSIPVQSQPQLYQPMSFVNPVQQQYYPQQLPYPSTTGYYQQHAQYQWYPQYQQYPNYQIPYQQVQNAQPQIDPNVFQQVSQFIQLAQTQTQSQQQSQPQNLNSQNKTPKTFSDDEYDPENV
ncbi:hypothetical protein KL905_002502 [Ogataea polymorpha]|uniref:H/ACA ribonucleoprotein complex non-core subunit NAF1 n=1 Tax=Ogataea polymorpha TaxID=460523 RepID=A0A9P8NWY8_9ASCO|nr:hypothetical protein KL937_002090 [Ogataea polymorpha]KAG7906606.1 hypothetical protein KL907_002246 [Ogataea polymorpha]KAG7909853.1 hypothetical protein KL906_001758 [Ogataea polymorpha]KAG7917553.1 hypothetical protein KL927_002296 [Ogataea polymorpha]KAG7921737.1 hypothetical protein KL905_002502 [Ogataea polymorpha]